MRTIYLVSNLGGHDFLQMIPNIPSARKEKREMVVAFECTKKSPGVHRSLEKKRKHGRNPSAEYQKNEDKKETASGVRNTTPRGS